MRKIKSRTAIIYKINNTIKKKFYSTLKPNSAHRAGPRHCVCGKSLSILLENEINILKKLENYEHFPKILDINWDEYSYTMSYCGITLGNLKKKKYKLPKNWKDQINNISKALTEQNIYNNDIALSNICILNDIIYMIDFGCCQPLDIKLKEKYDNRDNLIDLTKLFISF